MKRAGHMASPDSLKAGQQTVGCPGFSPW